MNFIEKQKAKLYAYKNSIAIYLQENKDRPIKEVYEELKTKKKLNDQEKLVYIYLKANRKKLKL